MTRARFLPEEKKAWFVKDRFGLFIHWGLYALPARHEWVKTREETGNDAYQVYFDHFDPDLYDPHDWAVQARKAGMKYVVLTAKHHEGFCLWDSRVTEHKATRTPCGRDLLKPFVEAFRAEGLKVGFYYSLLDWHHPDFTIDAHHPLRNHPDAAALNQGRDMRRYAAYMRDQVRELLTGYGKIDILWFDFSYPERPYKGLVGKGHKDWESEALLALVRELQPDVLVNNRLDLDEVLGVPPDITTPEQFLPREPPQVLGQAVTWESCHTFSGSWGYHRDETSWKSPEQLIHLLVDNVAMGGNLLMNVGPTGRGRFDDRARAALEVYGRWLDLHGRSIYGCGPAGAEVPVPRDCRLTRNGRRLYVHLYAWPFRHLHLDGLGGKVAYAQLLHDASEVKRLEPVDPSLGGNTHVPLTAGTLTLELPVQRPDVTVPVIELFLKES